MVQHIIPDLREQLPMPKDSSGKAIDTLKKSNSS